MMRMVRTTVTLDPDVEALLRARIREQGISFKQALNDAVRAGLAQNRATERPFRQRAFAMGLPAVNLDKALQLAGDLEDEELIRKLRLGK